MKPDLEPTVTPFRALTRWLALMIVMIAMIAATSLSSASSAAERDIVFIAPTNHAMPLAEFKNNVLAGGILKDLGDAIAQRMGMHARYLNVSSRRVPDALTSGEADGLCHVLPTWIDGNFGWTQAFIPNGGIIAARSGAPVVHKLADLADVPIGTVIGYKYPDFDVPLGKHFVREDAPSMENVLLKLAAGRTNYAVVERITLAYHLRKDPSLKLRADISYSTYNAQCAFSLKSQIPLADVDKAISSLVQDGSVTRILEHYR
jgi:ABC-type amino acid transport substrate-binding protein